MESLLVWCARHGRYLLVAGLLAGIFIEPLAILLKAWIPEMIGLMLLVAAFRVGPRAAIGAARDLQMNLVLVLIYQVALPLVLIGLLVVPAPGMTGWQAAT
ncbi:MAG: hypothetical protein KDJ69_09870, partial [Nitratireductor sp.]|nr:hypothetical protein [Nitratireductor sp.]